MNEYVGFDLWDIYNNSAVSDFRISTLFPTSVPKPRPKEDFGGISAVGINLRVIRAKNERADKKVVFYDFGVSKNKNLSPKIFFNCAITVTHAMILWPSRAPKRLSGATQFVAACTR